MVVGLVVAGSSGFRGCFVRNKVELNRTIWCFSYASHHIYVLVFWKEVNILNFMLCMFLLESYIEFKFYIAFC